MQEDKIQFNIRLGGRVMNEERCYECTGYGDDWYRNENGEWIHRCQECWVNEEEEEAWTAL